MSRFRFVLRLAARKGVILCVPPRNNRNGRRKLWAEEYSERWPIERTFVWVGNLRAIDLRLRGIPPHRAHLDLPADAQETASGKCNLFAPLFAGTKLPPENPLSTQASLPRRDLPGGLARSVRPPPSSCQRRSRRHAVTYAPYCERRILPTPAGPQHAQDPVQYPPIVHPRTAQALSGRQERLNPLPLLGGKSGEATCETAISQFEQAVCSVQLEGKSPQM